MQIESWLVRDVTDCESEYIRMFSCSRTYLAQVVITDEHFRNTLMCFKYGNDYFGQEKQFEQRFNNGELTDELIIFAQIAIDQNTCGLRVQPIKDLINGMYIDMRFTGGK
jgi:hypothetical protein